MKKNKTFERYLQILFADMLARFYGTNEKYIDNFVKEFFTLEKFEDFYLDDFIYEEELNDFVENVYHLNYYEKDGNELIYKFLYFHMCTALNSIIESKRISHKDMTKKVRFIISHKIRPNFMKSSEVGKTFPRVLTVD